MNENINENLSRLIQQQNRLLERQNELLEQLVAGCQQVNRTEEYIENIDRDEMRSGFLVTSHRKRLWNAQIGLIKEVARICKKYSIRWFVSYGTLLGAARHKGFIPWDDDVDISMFRPDYEKFKAVVADEIKHPYFVDAWQNYKLEDEESFSDADLPLVPVEQRRKNPSGWPFVPIIKLRDLSTTIIGSSAPLRCFFKPCIGLDIFAFDPVPPFSDKKQALNFEIERELLFAIVFPNAIKQAMTENQPLAINPDALKNFLKLPHKQRVLALDKFSEENFSMSEFVGLVHGFSIDRHPSVFATKDFAETVYLPFEKIEVPAPKGYENLLTAEYGDWHKQVITHSHAKEWSTDVSYEEYFANSV